MYMYMHVCVCSYVHVHVVPSQCLLRQNQGSYMLCIMLNLSIHVHTYMYNTCTCTCRYFIKLCGKGRQTYMYTRNTLTHSPPRLPYMEENPWVAAGYYWGEWSGMTRYVPPGVPSDVTFDPGNFNVTQIHSACTLHVHALCLRHSERVCYGRS